MKTSTAVLAAFLALAMLTGCAEDAHRIAAQTRTPEDILERFVALLAAITLLLVWLGGRGLKRGLLEGLQYTSAVMMAAAPLTYLAISRSVELAGAVGASGLIGLVVSTMLIFLERESVNAPVRRAPAKTVTPPSADND